MELRLFGINHKTTKLSNRELFIINDSNQEDFINFFLEHFGESIGSFLPFLLVTEQRFIFTELHHAFHPLLKKRLNSLVQVIL